MLQSATDEQGAVLGWLENLLHESEAGRKGVAELQAVLRYSEGGPAAVHLRVDPYLARGLSYYTGPIYEIELPGLSGSAGSGGRYDDLVGIFSGQSLPACGFSLGLERILLIMEERGMFPDRLAGQPQVLVTQYDESTANTSFQLAQELRAAGLRVDLYPDQDRFGKQFKYAEERSIRYVVLVSPREVQAGVVAVKDLVTGEQVDLPGPAVAEWLSERV
jgi:histidyl-tRNA synthetase